MSEHPRSRSARPSPHVPDEPLTPREAISLATVVRLNLAGVVVPVEEIPLGVGSGLVKLTRIAGGARPETHDELLGRVALGLARER